MSHDAPSYYSINQFWKKYLIILILIRPPLASERYGSPFDQTRLTDLRASSGSRDMIIMMIILRLRLLYYFWQQINLQPWTRICFLSNSVPWEAVGVCFKESTHAVNISFFDWSVRLNAAPIPPTSNTIFLALVWWWSRIFCWWSYRLN